MTPESLRQLLDVAGVTKEDCEKAFREAIEDTGFVPPPAPKIGGPVFNPVAMKRISEHHWEYPGKVMEIITQYFTFGGGGLLAMVIRLISLGELTTLQKFRDGESEELREIKKTWYSPEVVKNMMSGVDYSEKLDEEELG